MADKEHIKKLVRDLMVMVEQLKSGRKIDLQTALEVCKIVDKYGDKFGGHCATKEEYIYCHCNIIVAAEKEGII